MDRVLRFIEGNEEIKKAIPLFIESFVKFYGEDRRKEIEDKFTNLLAVGFQTPECIGRGLLKLETRKTKELLNKVFSGTNINLEEVLKHENFKNKDAMYLNYLFKLTELHRLGKEGRKEKFYNEVYEELKEEFNMTIEEYEELHKTKQIPERLQNLPIWTKNSILHSVDETTVEKDYKRLFINSKYLLEQLIPGINEDNFEELLNNEIIEELMSKKDEFEAAYEEFKIYIETLKPYYEEKERIDKNTKELEKKLYLEYVTENIDLFPEDKKEEVMNFVDGKTKFFEGNIQKIVGYSINSHSFIEDFSEEADNKLKENDPKDWKINTIKENRVKYFKIMGLDLGDDYEAYANSPEAQRLIPSKERIKKFIDGKNGYINRYNNAYYTMPARHKKIVSEVENADLANKDTEINARLYTWGNTCVMPNIIKTANGYKIFPILAVNFSNFDSDVIDHYIVHELNHIMELSLGLVGEKEYEATCGWDTMTETMEEIKEQVNTLEERVIRPYELFNEIINEMIAKEISQIMHDNGIYIFDDPSNSRYMYTTSYEESTFLVKDFFDEFRDTIIKSRSNGNIQLIFDEVGKENFDALNELFHIFNSKFTGVKLRQLKSDLKNNIDNESTRLLNEIREKRDRILEKMRKHRDMQKDSVIKESL